MNCEIYRTVCTGSFLVPHNMIIFRTFTSIQKSPYKALFDYSESETSLLNPTVLLQTRAAVYSNPTVRKDSNLELVWPKPVPDSCVTKRSLKASFPFWWNSSCGWHKRSRKNINSHVEVQHSLRCNDTCSCCIIAYWCNASQFKRSGCLH